MSNRQIVKEALEIWRDRGTYDDEQLDRAVKALVAHGMWSMTQMAKILDVSMREILSRTSKSEKTGGRFNPATLELALEEIALADLGDQNPLLTAKIWEMGTSPSFLARLIGQPVSTVQLRAANGRDEARALEARARGGDGGDGD